MVFPHVSPSVSTISSDVSTVFRQCFPRFLFQILRSKEVFHVRLTQFKFKELIDVKEIEMVIF